MPKARAAHRAAQHHKSLAPQAARNDVAAYMPDAKTSMASNSVMRLPAGGRCKLARSRIGIIIVAIVVREASKP